MGEELVRQLAAGEEGALKAFVREYEGRLLRFALKKARLEDAEEIVQDTLLAALDSLPLYSGKSSLFSWLCGICRHEIADFYRKRRIKAMVFSHFAALETLVSEVLGPEARLDRKEFRRRIRSAMGRLEFQQQRLLHLKYVEELSVKQVAHKLRLSFKTVESALFRARRAFVLAFAEAE